jgi:hypothetical protein
LSALFDKDRLIEVVTKESKELLQGCGNLSRDDLVYVATAAGRLKDERLKACIAELLRWGDDERARLETQIAIGIECMKLCTPSKIREAATRVELRYHIKIDTLSRSEKE